jgi:hypothetical protein
VAPRSRWDPSLPADRLRPRARRRVYGRRLTIARSRGPAPAARPGCGSPGPLALRRT